MNEQDKKVLTKHMALTAAGIVLQAAGNICLFAAVLGVVKEVNGRIKQAIIRELSK